VAAMLKTIFAQVTKVDAEAQWETVANALRGKVEKLGIFMDASRIRHCRSDHVWMAPWQELC
jgi:putative transposase